METCQSPWTVMRTAHALAVTGLPGFRSKFSRHDFTLAQLFACLVVREQLKLSYRRTEALLRDTGWCERLGMTRVPDHSTLCRAFDHLVTRPNLGRALDLLAVAMTRAGSVGRTLAIDSTCYDPHHFTRHYERRRSQHARGDENLVKQRTSRTLAAMPKLAIGIDTRTHLATCAMSRTGQRGDAPDFAPLLREACGRCPPRAVLADAGYDSAANHAIARDRLGVCSWIKAKAGRPSPKPAVDPHRRSMQEQLQGTQAGRLYGQRAQVETVMSMLKRNLGGHLRCRTRIGRELEMLFKVVVHNLMIA